MTDRFELLEELGTGGMGTVWKARDAETGDVVALKLLHRQFVSDAEYVARFEREVELARRIDSPYVVRVLGFGRQDGTPYVAMEFVDGSSLKSAIADHGPYAWDSAEGKRLALQLTEALVAAHTAGVVHRDIKPSNVLLDGEGNVHLADFGIARAADVTRLTGTMTVLGTPAYMAPDGPVSEQSDLYSLGCVLYEALTGTPPFTGETPQQLMLQHMRDAPNLQALPTGARKLIGWLLEKDPRHRPGTAAAFLAVLQGTSSAPRRPIVPRRPVMAGAIAGAMGLAVIGAVSAFVLYRGGDDGQGQDPSNGVGLAETATRTSPPSVIQSSTPTPAPTATTATTQQPSVTASPETSATSLPSPASSPTTGPATPTATPTPTLSLPAGQFGALIFEPNTSAYPVPGELEICWKGSPVGTRFFITITMTSPRSEEWSSEYVASEFTTCRFLETRAGDGPNVSFEALARDDYGAIVARASYTMSTYPLPTARTPPEILTVSGPATARLEEHAIIRVDWRDKDGNALDVTLLVEGAVHQGTETPFSDSRDVSLVPASKQSAGDYVLFGLVCGSVDPDPRKMTVTIRDSAGMTDSYESSFACLP